MITSNRSGAEWGAVFGDAVVANAILDRLLHHSHVLTSTGESYRLRERRRRRAQRLHEATHAAINVNGRLPAPMSSNGLSTLCPARLFSLGTGATDESGFDGRVGRVEPGLDCPVDDSVAEVPVRWENPTVQGGESVT